MPYRTPMYIGRHPSQYPDGTIALGRYGVPYCVRTQNGRKGWVRYTDERQVISLDLVVRIRRSFYLDEFELMSELRRKLLCVWDRIRISHMDRLGDGTIDYIVTVLITRKNMATLLRAVSQICPGHRLVTVGVREQHSVYRETGFY